MSHCTNSGIKIVSDYYRSRRSSSSRRSKAKTSLAAPAAGAAAAAVRQFLGSILALFRPSGPSGRVRFQSREEEQQQQQREQQEGSISYCTNSGITIGRKL